MTTMQLYEEVDVHRQLPKALIQAGLGILYVGPFPKLPRIGLRAEAETPLVPQ